MGFYTTEPAFSRGVGNGKRAVGFFSADHRRNAPSRPAKALARQGFSAVVSRTSAPDAPLYGYRYYSPEHGRWVNRDPIEELLLLKRHHTAQSAGDVLALRMALREQGRPDPQPYFFVYNNSVARIDMLGLVCVNLFSYTYWRADDSTETCGDWSTWIGSHPLPLLPGTGPFTVCKRYCKKKTCKFEKVYSLCINVCTARKSIRSRIVPLGQCFWLTYPQFKVVIGLNCDDMNVPTPPVLAGL